MPVSLAAAIAFVLILLGVSLKSALWLLFSVPFLAGLVSAVYAGRSRVEVSRRISGSYVLEQESTSVSLIIRNSGTASGYFLVKDILPELVELVEGRASRMLFLTPGEEGRFEYRVRSARGGHEYREVSVTGFLPSGIRVMNEYLPCPGNIQSISTPEKFIPFVLTYRNTLVYSGINPANTGGEGNQFFDVRPYMTGDKRNRIDWRQLAKNSNTLMTRTYEQERMADIGIIVDARKNAYFEYGDGEDFEMTLEAADKMSTSLINQNNRVGLIVVGSQITRIYPGFGKKQLWKIHQTLADARLGDHAVFNSLESFPYQMLPRRSELIYVGPVLMEDINGLLQLKRLGYRVLTIAVTRSYPEPTPARTIAVLERKTILSFLQRNGIGVIQWDSDVSFESAFRAHSPRLLHMMRDRRM